MADNRFVSVPHDLSCLEHVEDINLNGNIFEDLKQVILALTTMPSLRSLHINLHEEEQVDFIFRNMPNLAMIIVNMVNISLKVKEIRLMRRIT